MSKQQELQSSNVPYTTPIIMEHDQEGEDVHESASSSCFSLFCCFENHHHHNGESTSFLYQNQSGGDVINKDTWFMKRAKSLKEYSELVAGPKWKNFIRKFSRRTKTQFQYDLQSYALNFNDGDDHENDDLLPRSFSTRFAPPSRSVRE